MSRPATLLAVVLAAALVACGSGEPSLRSPGAANRLRVVATLPPLASLAQELGGERVEARSLLGPRANPETGALRLSAARELSDADLVVALGGGALPFEQQVLRALDHEGATRVVVVLEGAGARAEDAHGVDELEDPHAWLDPDRMLEAARRLTRALAALDPQGEGEYRRGLERLAARVRGVDERLRARLNGSGALLLAEHPTWQVLSRRYGVRVVSIEQEEREPSARRLAEAIDRAREGGARVVAVSAGGRHRLAGVVSRETGASIVELEPLAYDWLASLERAADLAAGLSGADPETPHG